jgi:MoxR-like ATPase
VFSLSEPGAAKSMMATRLALRVKGAVRFKKLFTPFTTDTDLFGLPNIPAMKEGRSTRLSDGLLPSAHFFQGEEVFKGNASALTALLEILERDREYLDDNQTKRAPLWCGIMSSNEMPQATGETLAALWDRILLRQVVPGWTDTTQLKEILRLPPPNPTPTPVLTVAEVEEAQRQVAAVVVPEDLQDLVADKIAGPLRARHGITLSARRIAESMTLVQAAAWLDGADKAEPEHAEILAHCYWEQPEQRSDVYRVVAAETVPLVSEILDLEDAIGGIVDLIDSAKRLDATDPNRGAMSQEVLQKLRRAAEDVVRLEAGVTARGRKRLDASGQRVEALSDQLATELMGLSTLGSRLDEAREKAGR